MKFYTLKKLVLAAICIAVPAIKSLAQLPTCTGASTGLIYYVSGTGQIYNLDPTLPLSASNPTPNTISAPTGFYGISLGPNLNAASPSPTFYVTDGNVYEYYNGSGWTNTGFTSGWVNPGGGGPYIYSLNGSTGAMTRYNGTGNATVLTLSPPYAGNGGPYDVNADCSGNFFLLKIATPNPELLEYNPTGTLINTWTITSSPGGTAGGGFAIVNGHVYFDNNSGFYGGTISGSNITVYNISPTSLNPNPYDFASCPVGGISQNSVDTVFVCSGGSGTVISAPSNTGTYTFQVLSGPAVLTGTGYSRTVTAAANSVVLGSGIGTGCGGGDETDTFRIIVPTAVVSAGLPVTLTGCGVYTDTLSGNITDTESWINYAFSWTPAGTISSGANTLHPVIHPFANTTYKFYVTTAANQGGCTFVDSGRVTVVDARAKALYGYTIGYGCSQDTINLTNQSTNATRLFWDFGDGTGSVTANPTHIYAFQGVHTIKLRASNNTCRDSISKTVDPPHPIHAAFSVNKDTICQTASISFTNHSVGTNATYNWDFGDGGSDTAKNPIHIYMREGHFLVKLAVTDFVPCHDTAVLYVNVDSVSFLRLTVTDTILCEGKIVHFSGAYLDTGFTGNIWNFGDGTIIRNENPISHSYETPGTYHVSLTADYRACPDTTVYKDITVYPYPTVNVGADTALCPNSGTIYVYDIVNSSNPAARWLWSTGDTTSGITVGVPGLYYTTVTIGNCANTDSMLVRNDCYLDIPNVFSPNNDGVNDYFFPRQQLSSSVTSFKLDIFNRWGQLIFETINIDGRGWDGKFNNTDQPEGVYIYMINATFKDGTTQNYKGNITLLR